MTAIALFGGSFNPPHVAHQMVALFVLETAPVDELWITPTYRHAFSKQLVDYEHRIAMCELMALGDGVDDIILPHCRERATPVARLC